MLRVDAGVDKNDLIVGGARCMTDFKHVKNRIMLEGHTNTRNWDGNSFLGEGVLADMRLEK